MGSVVEQLSSFRANCAPLHSVEIFRRGRYGIGFGDQGFFLIFGVY